MPTYWYMDGAQGRRYCWNRDPTFQCPHGFELWDCVELGTGKVLRRGMRLEAERPGITFKRHISIEMAHSAKMLGVDPEKLARILYRAHHAGFKRARVNGKLTDQCDTCGARMKRLGFRCWIERPVTEEESREPGAQITRGMGWEPTKTIKSFYLDTKREAQQWAREEAKLAKAIQQSESDR